MEQRLYQPTVYIPSEVKGPVIFLAGPIQGTADWQTKAAEYLMDKNPNLIIANPRRKYLDGEFVFANQVDWEYYHLMQAARTGVILFWLANESEQIAKRAYAQTTRVELGMFIGRHEFQPSKFVVGIDQIGNDDGFSGAKYFRHMLAKLCPEVQISTTLISTCDTALSLLTKSA